MASRLSVGLNLFFLVEASGGTRTYAQELVRAMSRVAPDTRFTGFISSEPGEEILGADWGADIRWIRLPGTVSHGPPWNAGLSVLSQWALEPWHAKRLGLDVVHGLANVAPLWAPGAARVVTFHDLIWMHHPGTMTRRDTLGMKVLGLASARRADCVIAISDAVRKDLIATVGLPAAKVTAVAHGIGQDSNENPTPEGELRGRLGLGSGPVVLCVAQKRSHKNLAALVEAVAQLPDDRVRLVVPGAQTPYEHELRRLVQRLGIEHRVRFPPWVSASDLEGLYALASCFVLPSLYEGFGLTVLEAMCRRVPVACSNTTSLPEVAGDAALLFDPRDTGAIRVAVERLLTDHELAHTLADAGLVQARRFTWEQSARATLSVYRRAIATLARSGA